MSLTTRAVRYIAAGSSSSDSDSSGEMYSKMEQPTLLKQIKTILDEYPDDGQIIKELVQNADDAGATQMRIMYDGRTTKTAQTDDKRYRFRKFFKAPAIVFYNNAEFTEQDWKGIKMVYNSVKEDCPLKIGRFGLGFKSVFHLTDYPCIISGDTILVINPIESNPLKVCVTLKLKEITKCKHIRIKDCLDAFEGIYGFNEDTINSGKYHGSLFWFSLRNKPSKLSENLYTESKVIDLFKAFMFDSGRSLLFLKSLHRVGMSVSIPTSTEESPVKTELSMDERSSEPKETEFDNTELSIDEINLGKDVEFFSVEIDDDEGKLCSKRKCFFTEIEEIGKTLPKQSLHCIFDASVQVKQRRKSYHLKDSESKSRWLIVNYLKGGDISERLKALVQDETLSNHPLVGIAAPVNENSIYTESYGHIFCFQPLPQESHSLTGLPIHVNAFFAVSQNRRHLKWPSEDQLSNDMHTDKAVCWNQVLISEVLPHAYAELHYKVIELSQRNSNPNNLVTAAYNMIPDTRKVNVRWKTLANEFIKLVATKDILFTEQGNGRWLNINEAVVSLSMAGRNLEERRLYDSVVALIQQDQVNLTQIPDNVKLAIEQTGCRVTELSPSFLAEHLRKFHKYKDLTLAVKENLLDYMCLDKNFDRIGGLEFLPLQDGTFVSFNNEPHVFLEKTDVIALFPGQEKMFVSDQANSNTNRILTNLIDIGKYQIRHLDLETVVDLLKRTIGDKFGNVQIVYVDKLNLAVWQKWIIAVWDYIETNFSQKVGTFSNLPLFPVFKTENGETDSLQLHPLSSLLLLKNYPPYNLNNDICECFAHLSVTIVHTIPEWMTPDLVQRFLHNGSSESIKHIIGQIDQRNTDVFNTQSTTRQREALVSFLSNKVDSDLPINVKRILCKLLLFKEFAAINAEPKWISLDKNDSIFDEKEFPIAFPSPKLMVHPVKTLALNIGGKEYRISDMILDTFRKIDKYSKGDVKMFMYWFIEKRHYLCNDGTTELAKQVRFLETGDGHFYRPMDLFDGSDKLIEKIFRSGNLLLSDKSFLNEGLLPGVRALGLKTIKDVKSVDIDNICQITQDMSTRCVKHFDQVKVKALLEFLEDHIHLLRECSITELNWIHVSQERMESYPACLPFYNEGISICAPSELRSSKFVNLIGSVLPVIDCKAFTGTAAQFGWTARPDVRSVVKHLRIVIKSYKSEYKASLLPIITNIYEWLHSQNDIEEVRSALQNIMVPENIDYVWIGDKFVSTEHVFVEANDDDMDLKPFVNILPTEIQHLKNFFEDLGCAKRITADTYVDTIEQISNISEQFSCKSASKMKNMVINILTKLREHLSTEILQTCRTIYFPVHTGDETILKLKPANQCTYCDAQWLKDVDYLEEEDGIIYVHGDVPNATAEALGVPSLTQQILSDAEALEEWGQEEPLTRRINCLLKEGYVDGFSVPKELFQNADDAGASKLWFLYDERENNDARTKLLSEGMAECQGPALWVYNDAEFTDKDLKSITKINAATKEDDSSTIGKFGLGFCSVYNITDVPCFVSKDNIIFFDPHKTFLGKALPGNSPGLKLNLSKMKNLRMMKKISNQFKPFENVFGCKLLNVNDPTFKGTLFRFPLRTKGSDISDSVYTAKEMKKLMEIIIEKSANMLLFTQSITDLRLFYLQRENVDPSNAVLLYKVNKTVQPLLDDSCMFQQSILKEASKRKRCKELVDKPIKVLHEVSITTDSYGNSLLNTSPKSFETSWLVSWATGTDEQSIRLTDAEPGALPLGSVAVPLNKAGGTYSPMPIVDLPDGFYKESHLFFFLPLPLVHSLLFHISCPFSVSSDRRQLRATTEDDKNTTMKEWNESLFRDCTVKALLFMLESMSKLDTASSYMFYELWPEHGSMPLIECVTNSFYKHALRSDSFKIFKSRESWHACSSCIFLDQPLRNSRVVGEFAFQVLLHFSTINKAVDIPEKYYQLLLKADKSIVEETTISTELFLLKYFLPNLHHFVDDDETKKKRNELLKYSVCLSNSNVDKWLKENACIPATPKGTLLKPSELIERESEIAVLFTAAFGRFPIETFGDKETSERLRELGMMHDKLSNTLMLDRARTITYLNDSKCAVCAKELCCNLLSYLSKQLKHHADAVNDLRSIPCLPVMTRQPDWPSQWKADCLVYDTMCEQGQCERKCHNLKMRSHFVTPPELYDGNCKNLVCCLTLVLDMNACTTTSQQSNIHVFQTMIHELGVQNKDEISVDMLISQLYIFVNKYTPNQKAKMRSILEDIYDMLESQCGNEENQSYIANKLELESIIWVSNCFTTPCFVALTSESCPPYLYGLRESMFFRYTQLCRALKIQNYFKPNCIAKILQDLYYRYNDRPLLETDVECCLKLLEMLHKNIQKARLTCEELLNDRTIAAIYAPDDQCILRDTKAMCFDDYSAIEKSDTMIFIHGRVNKIIAKAFGVKPKLIQNLEDTSEDIDDFYQNEPLLTRLHGLLDGYPCDSGIFKELIQNADDAGASEIHFLNDKTTHGKAYLLGDRFEPLQGPALCVFNNSAFTQQDLKGIQKLGQGSKNDDPSKTGQYGVGFNAVYNLTDAPSFLTKGSDIENDETLCVFDPMAKYIPLTSKTKPGKRYKNVKSLRANYKDVLEGYHETHFFDRGNGTVFRFPLRDKLMARESEIKNECVSCEMISKMFETLSTEIAEMLIFLKNLKKVSLGTCTYKGYSKDFVVEVKLSNEDLLKRNVYVQHHKMFCNKFKESRVSSIEMPQQMVNYEISITENNTVRKNYIVVQSTGYREKEDVPKLVRQHVENKHIGLLPQGGVALLKQITHLHLQNAPTVEIKTPCKAFCFLPLPIETDLPVHVHGHFALDHETRRTLWKSDLVEMCYKTQWNLSLIRNVIAPAYILLLERMKVTLMETYELKDMEANIVLTALQTFHECFPIVQKADGFYWKELAKNVYQGLVYRNVKFLPSLTRHVHNEYAVFQSRHLTTVKLNLSWTSLKVVNFTYPAYHNPESTNNGNKESAFNINLRNVGMRIVSVPEKMRTSMEDSDVTLQLLSPRIVMNYLSSHSSENTVDKCTILVNCTVRNTTVTSVHNVRTLLEYCLQDTYYFLEHISKIPLFITPDEHIRCVDEGNPMFVTKFNNFFPNEFHRFLHTSLYSTLETFSRPNKVRVQNALKSFTLPCFLTLLEQSKLGNMINKEIYDWDKEVPTKQLIGEFWTFFWQSLPNLPLYEHCQDKMNKINESIKLLNKWSFLPVVEAIQPDSLRHHLLPVTDRGKVLYLENFTGDTKKALKKMNIFQLDEECFIDRNSNVPMMQKMTRHIPNFEEPREVLACLNMNMDKVNAANLTKNEALAVLQYISTYLDACLECGYRAEIKEQIKRLPIFITHYEKIVALTSCTNVYIVPQSMPSEGLETLSNNKQIILLQFAHLKQNMCSLLEITETAVIDIYVNYIIPLQMQMERDSFYRHVEFMAILFNSPNISPCQKEKLCSCMRRISFVETSEGMKRINELYSPKIKVYREMCKESELLPDELQACTYSGFFDCLELQVDITIDFYIRHATEIADDGRKNGLTQYVCKLSKLLVQSLMGMPELFLKNESLGRLKDIQFIVPAKAEKHLVEIHKQHNSQNLICFADSVLNDKIGICWTSVNVLPSWANPGLYQSVIMEKLQISKHPNFTTFVNHCKNIGTSLAQERSQLHLKRDSDFAVKVKKIMENVYKAFEEYSERDEINNTVLSQLAQTPMIYFPEETAILTARNVINECNDTEQIPPYVQKSPVCFGQYFDVFRLLGVADKPSCDTFATVLQTVAIKSKGEELLPPELDVVKHALSNFLVYIEKSCAKTEEIQVSSLFIPNWEMKLQKASEVIICDNVSYRKRLPPNAGINFFLGFDTLEIIVVGDDGAIERFKRIPEQYRPIFLNEIVGEKVQIPESSPTCISSTRQLAEFLHCKDFIVGMVRLIKHAMKAERRNWDTNFEKLVTDKLRKIAIRQVKGMHTVLTVKRFENGSFGQPTIVENTSEKKFVHIEETDINTCIYVETGKDDWYDGVKIELTVYLNRNVESCLKGEYLAMVFLILSQINAPEKITNILDKRQIDPFEMTIEEVEPLCPKPGTFVPPKFHPFLDNDCGLIKEYDYKFVVYEVEDPVITDEDENMDIEPTYIYCRILGLVEENNNFPLLQKYEIDIGEETSITTYAYKLYKFVRKKSSPNSASTDLVVSIQPEYSERSLELKEVFKEIRRYLNEAWKNSDTERKHIVKRLCLKWHPDKNIGNEKFCTKVFQYIQQCLRKLRSGQTLPEDDDSDFDDTDSGSRSQGTTNYGYSSGRSWYSSFFENIGRRYRKHRKADRSWFSSSSNGWGSYHYSESKREPFHYYSEARRWQKQATSDFRNAQDSLMEMSDPSYNWICYKCHQAAEKSLKAAWYAEDANKIADKKYTHQLYSIAQGLDGQLRALAGQLTALTGEHTRMRYPDMHMSSTIPAEAYHKDCVEEVCKLTEKILYIVSSTYLSK